MTIVGSVGDETTIVDVWLTATLAGDSMLTDLLAEGVNGVHSEEAPPGAQYPLLIHHYQGGADVRGAGPFRIMHSGLWVVKACAETRDYLTVKPIADRIDELLNAAAGTTDDGLIFSAVREQPLRMWERDNAHDFRYLGGIYRILAQKPAS